MLISVKLAVKELLSSFTTFTFKSFTSNGDFARSFKAYASLGSKKETS